MVGCQPLFAVRLCAYDIKPRAADEGAEDIAVSGPSGGQVLGVVIASEALRVIRGVDLPICNDITFTGKIEQKSGIAGFVGGIHPKDMTAKLDVSIIEGFRRVSIPLGQLEDLKRDYPEYLEIAKSQGTEIIGARDLVDNLTYATGSGRGDVIRVLLERGNPRKPRRHPQQDSESAVHKIPRPQVPSYPPIPRRYSLSSSFSRETTPRLLSP